MKKTAIVLLNLGGPASLEEVEPFLFRLFYDPAILTLPNPLRYILARAITKRRLPEAKRIYGLMGGGSPLLKNTKSQAFALQKELGKGFRVFTAMRYAPPFTAEAVERVKAYDPEKVILLPLYPQYSTTTTGSALDAWKKETQGWKVPTHFIRFYPKNEEFLLALKDLTLPIYQKAKEINTPHVILTAHGLPKKMIKRGDPYQFQVEETAKNFIKKLGLSPGEWTLCYQSRIGPLPWIGPSTKEEIVEAARDRRPLIVIPLSFVSEHSETLVELDIFYRDLALANGCPAYYRVKTVQTHPLFIKGLASMVKEVLQNEDFFHKEKQYAL